MKFCLFVVLWLLAAAYPVEAWAYERFPAFEVKAAGIVGKQVEIRCHSQQEWESFPFHQEAHAVTWFGESGPQYISLSPRICISLVWHFTLPWAHRWSYRPTRSEEALSLLVLYHEAFHMTGERDEGVTECNAIRLLGKEQSLEIYRLALLWHNRLPAAYRTVC